MFARRLCLALLSVLAVAWATPGLAGRPSVLRSESLQIVTHDSHVHRFRVEIADTDASRERGLMFRKSLAPDAGMLFDFRRPQNVAFWMRNTLIPLDMLFLDDEGYIINLAPSAPPLSQTRIPSGGKVLGVLELRGGRSAELGIQPGDRVLQRIFRRRSRAQAGQN